MDLVDNPLFDEENDWPVDRNNIQPRVAFAYNFGDNRTIMRGGYGRFFDKTHFEVIGGVLTNRPFTTSFTSQFPLKNVDPGPIRGQRPTDPFLANGPVLTDALRAQLAALFPAGSAA